MNNSNSYEFNKIDEKYGFDGEMGAIYSKYNTVFRVFSPTSENVVVNIYDKSTDTKKSEMYDMKLLDSGIWEVKVDKDLKNKYYTYTIYTSSTIRETIDIYAKSCSINGKKGFIFDDKDATPNNFYTHDTSMIVGKDEAIIYELHVRDFSSDSHFFVNKGKFRAFLEEDVKNDFKDVIGLDYIKNLGVTHIHLLPIFDYATVDEDMPISSYNWGYDPLNYNAIEGSYSINPYDPLSRVRECKEMIMKIHEKGMGVIMDVVYNHTYNSYDSSFSKIYPHYYYRHFANNYSNGSGCGNEMATERKMMRKYIIDSLCYYAKNFRIDGFRFDLMGLIDIETLNLASNELKKINPNIILYGEGWTGGDSPLNSDSRAIKSNAVKVPDYSMFSDDFRDIIKGNVFDEKNCGYINGDNEKTYEIVKSLLIGGVYNGEIDRGISYCWSDDPMQSINYVEAHDNYTFYDKLKLSMVGASEEDIIKVNKLGAVLVFLSQGVPFIQAGQEFLRSKYDGKVYHHNSYNLDDSINSLKWNDVSKHKDVVDYYRGLVEIRKNFYEFRMKTAEEICQNISFEDIKYGAFIMYVNDFMLIVNPLSERLKLDIKGVADVYVDEKIASKEPIYTVENIVYVSEKSAMLIRHNYENIKN